MIRYFILYIPAKIKKLELNVKSIHSPTFYANTVRINNCRINFVNVARLVLLNDF